MPAWQIVAFGEQLSQGGPQSNEPNITGNVLPCAFS